ncbi:PrpF domain-containing protein [Saccharopolyspora sp. NPDC002686]|uniref:PrpF domain-containing protein n=1 Tax=Saccharopolyspora sp. NPDC002686 TaxID=3154541 RepID=UPI00332F4BA7
MHVPATLVRGGTSKCWLFDRSALPTGVDATARELEGLLVNAYGAADPVQLDGIGGATPTTSKAAVVGASDAPGIDVDYLFGQVGIGVGRVEWGSNCGNCATAIALWAVARGLVPVTGDLTRVVLRNTNTGAVLEAEVDTTGGHVHEFGTRTVPGTRAGGVAVGLTFVDPVGRTTGSVTPTGRVLDGFTFAGLPVEATAVDAGAPVVLLDAAGIGRTGVETLAEVRDLVDPLRAVRHAAALRMGLSNPGDVPDDAVPKVGIVGKPAAYRTSLGDDIAADDYDVSVRMLSMNAPHPAIGLTSAVGVAVAAMLDGSVVRRASATTGATLRIGTPAGVIAVACSDVRGAQPLRVTVERAARILCEADLLVPDLLPA